MSPEQTRSVPPARRLALGLCAAVALLASPAEAAPHRHHAPLTPSARLARLFAADARAEAAFHPLDNLARASRVEQEGLARLFTPEADRRQLAQARAALAALSRIDRARLNPDQRLSVDVFAVQKRMEIAFLSPPLRRLEAVQPFSHFQGPHVTFPTMMATGGVMSYADDEDYRAALALDEAFATTLDNARARFAEGLALGLVEPRITVVNMIAQIDALLALGVEDSPFMSPLKAMPGTISEAERERLYADYARVIGERINPAYARLRAFLAERYLPAARWAPGLSAMPGGTLFYRRLIERETTLPLAPEAIHRLGLAEVARIQREMEGVKAEMGFAGPLRAFFDEIRANPKYHPKTAADLAEGFAAIGRKVDAQIPRFFARVPRTEMLIAAYPDYRARYEAGASYDAGAEDASRPGTFWFNTYDLPSRFLTGMTTLYLHEGKPGHHFQISLAQENTKLPDFQRFGGNNAFVEGWALYAETLGYDMGLYKDPWQHWGTLDDEMLRAMRLVVDTGLHTMGWSREQAIDYMLANSGMGRSDATAEVERYIAEPAQALSYKIGSLTIQRLRRKAESALGPRFDIRQFHEHVLNSGALPLPVLEAKIDRWIAATRLPRSGFK